MISYTIYNPATGGIACSGNCHESAIHLQAGLYPGMAITPQHSDPERDYVDLTGEPVVTPRPTLFLDKLEIEADDNDAAILAVGQPFTAIIDGESYQIDSGVLELTSAMPAAYKVVVDHFPFMRFEAEVVAS